MIRRILTVAALAAASTLSAAEKSHAQDLSSLAAWNMAQDQQFMNWAWQGSMQLARELPDDVTPNQIIAAMQPYTTGNMYGGYNAGWWNNQAVNAAAMNNFSRHMRDEAIFTNPYTGQSYQMPSYPGGYYQDPAGWMYQGHHPTNFTNNFWYDE